MTASEYGTSVGSAILHILRCLELAAILTQAISRGRTDNAQPAWTGLQKQFDILKAAASKLDESKPPKEMKGLRRPARLAALSALEWSNHQVLFWQAASTGDTDRMTQVLGTSTRYRQYMEAGLADLEQQLVEFRMRRPDLFDALLLPSAVVDLIDESVSADRSSESA